MTPAAACPAANLVAALAVDLINGSGTPADAEPCDNSTASEPPESVTPRRVSRPASIALALDNRPETVPIGQPSCSAACLWVFPSRSHNTTGRRYFSGRRLNS